MALTGLAFSDNFEGMILTWLTNGQPMNAITNTNLYVGLLTQAIPFNPTSSTGVDTGTFASPVNPTELTTVNGAGGWAGYTRRSVGSNAAVANRDGSWSGIAQSGGATTVDFTGQFISNLSAIGGQGTGWQNAGTQAVNITGVGIYSTPNVGDSNLLMYVALASAQSISVNSAFQIAAGGLQIEID